MKTLKRLLLALLLMLIVAAGIGWFSLDKEARGLLATFPTNRDILFWSEPQRDAAFRALDRLPVLAKARVVPAGGGAFPAGVGTLTVAVGPEGGWAPGEVPDGLPTVGLGRTVLRVETAAVVAAVLAHRRGVDVLS
mgnify:CR=1 FL=1